jgi:hypothetical protein
VFILCLFVDLKQNCLFGLWCLRHLQQYFSYIIYISWWSVLSVKETGVPGEKHRPVASHWQTLSPNVVSSTPCHERVRTHNFSGHRPRLIAQVVVNPTTIRSSRRRLNQKVHCLFFSVVSLLTLF